MLAICGCDPLGKQRYRPPSKPPTVGVRIIDGELRIWTGSPCPGTTEVYLVFDMGQPDAPALQLTAPGPGVRVEYLTVGDPYPGFDIARALPPDFDWHTAETLYVSISGPPAAWNVTIDLADALDGSAQHPDDTYWFQGFGWLDPAEVAAQNGEKFLTLCTPDPAGG
ncbi:hypothetical protein ACWDTP_13215 [Mycobacterium sp. NPDC003449]